MTRKVYGMNVERAMNIHVDFVINSTGRKHIIGGKNMADHHMFLIHIATIMKVSNHVIIITN